LAVAAKIKPPERDDECDLGCAVATHNLGEFAEMDGDIAEARRKQKALHKLWASKKASQTQMRL
jgi:hypothetical protein